MTGKLIKYEFRSVIRQIGVLWAATPIMAIIFMLIDKFYMQSEAFETGKSAFASTLQIISGFVYAGVFLALLVATVLIVLQRFYKGLLRDEGYLMHTLPVKPWQLITAKGFTAFVVVIISGIIAVISIFFLMGVSISISDLGELLGDIFGMYSDEPVYILYTIEAVLLMALAILKSIYKTYASMSIGQLSDNHKILISVAAYIGISVAIMFITGVFLQFMDGEMFEGLIDYFSSLSRFKGVQLVVAGYLLYLGVQLAAFHITSERLLTKKLNLD